MLASPSLLAHGRVVVSASRVEVEVTAARHERREAFPVALDGGQLKCATAYQDASRVLRNKDECRLDRRQCHLGLLLRVMVDRQRVVPAAVEQS